jgi:hypothetical protein
VSPAEYHRQATVKLMERAAAQPVAIDMDELVERRESDRPDRLDRAIILAMAVIVGGER